MTIGINDGRKLSHGELERVRLQAIRRVLAGESPETVIREIGFSRGRIYEWLARYREKGEEGLKARPLAGRPRALTDARERWLVKSLMRKTPRALGTDTWLWSPPVIREVVARRFGIKPSLSTVNRWLEAMLLDVRPRRLASWRETGWYRRDYAAIRGMARHCKAQILLGWERRWADCRLLTVATLKGRRRFMLVQDEVTPPRFIEFLRRLLRESPRPIFLILTGNPVHRSPEVTCFANNAAGKIRLFFLPEGKG
ncbi:MAG: transposase [Verrucomicrobia bacterium]|nr:transposase [Verrucomicrobiota bacterium]